MRHSQRRAGFTLVELLVAISILAIVAVLGWRGLDGIVRGRIVLTEQMENTRGMQLAFAQMQSDCEHLAEGSVLGRRPYLQWDADRLTLVRKVYVENEPSRLQVVSYRVSAGQLLRRESPATRNLLELDQLWQSISSDAPAQNAPPVALQNGVLGMQIQVWRGNAWRADPGLAVGNPVPVPIPAAVAAEPTGVLVALNVQNLAAPMVKSFLLGGT